MRTRTARFLFSGYLAFIVYMDLAFSLASNNMVSLPLGITAYFLWGEVAITMHVIAIVFLVFLFKTLRKQQLSPIGV